MNSLGWRPYPTSSSIYAKVWAGPLGREAGAATSRRRLHRRRPISGFFRHWSRKSGKRAASEKMRLALSDVRFPRRRFYELKREKEKSQGLLSQDENFRAFLAFDWNLF